MGASARMPPAGGGSKGPFREATDFSCVRICYLAITIIWPFMPCILSMNLLL